MPAKVLHILGTAQPEGTGIARIVAALARGLDAQRYRIHAWFLAGDGPLATELQAAGAEVRSIDWSGGARDPAGTWRFWRNLRSERFSIIHQHFGGRAPRWLARSVTQAKVITHLHGQLIESQGLAPIALRVQGADVVIAVSQAVANCVGGARPRVVYSGVDISNDGGPISALSDGCTDIVVGTAARLIPLKGIEYLIRAMAMLCDDYPCARLEIAGSGPERPALEREVQLHHLGDHVTFLGWQKDVRSMMAGWDIYVQPSIVDSLPVATIEAMAASLPVVATKAGGLPELVEEGQTGWLVPPCDATALAERIRALLLDPERRCRMGAAGRARVRESFSVDRMVKAISSIYDEVLADVGKAAG